MSHDTIHETTFEMPIRSDTDTNALGSAIANAYKDSPDRPVVLVAMGMACIEKAYKGVMNANKHLSNRKQVLLIHPGMEDREMTRDRSIKTVTLFRLVLRNIDI